MHSNNNEIGGIDSNEDSRAKPIMRTDKLNRIRKVYLAGLLIYNSAEIEADGTELVNISEILWIWY